MGIGPYEVVVLGFLIELVEDGQAFGAEAKGEIELLDAELVAPQGVEPPGEARAVAPHPFDVQLPVPEEDLVRVEAVVLFVGEFAAEARPGRLVGVPDHALLQGAEGLGLPASHDLPDRLKEGLKGRRILGIAAEQDNQDKVLVDEALIPGVGALVPAAVLHDEPLLRFLRDGPAEAVALPLLVRVFLAAVELHGGVHEPLGLRSEQSSFPQHPVPAEQVEDVGIHVAVAAGPVLRDHVSVVLGEIRKQIPPVLQHHGPGEIVGGPAVPADVADRGIAHAGGLEDPPLHKVLEGQAGDPLHDEGQQAVVAVGIAGVLAGGEVGLRAALAEEAEDVVVVGDPVLFFPDPDQPVDVVKIIGHAAGVGQQVADRDAGVREFGEELRDLVLQVQQALLDQQHDRRGGELLADGGQVEDAVLAQGEPVLGVAPAQGALGENLAVLGVEPGAVEETLLMGLPDQIFHHCLLVHNQILHS